MRQSFLYKLYNIIEGGKNVDTSRRDDPMPREESGTSREPSPTGEICVLCIAEAGAYGMLPYE